MEQGTPRTRREEYTEATRQALLEAGRTAFAREGFQAAGIEDISRSARVTRGAFYHHFADKKALFDAVVVLLQADAAAAIEAKARRKAEVWDRLQVGIRAYLDVCIEPAYARIVVQEAPVVLGPARFREIEEAYPMALLAATLSALVKRGEIETRDVTVLTRLLDAMICKVAIMLLDADDATRVRAEGQRVIDHFLDGLRVLQPPDAP